MRNSDQPQNTKQNLVRDASVQIDAPAKNSEKAELLIKGFKARMIKENPERTNTRMDSFGLGEFAYLLAALTSASKSSRDHAKEEIRELVKLGKEAGNENAN